MGEVVLDPGSTSARCGSTRPSSWPSRRRRSASSVLICEADRCAGPVLDLPLEAIGSTRGDPTNVDLAGATAAGIPVLRAPGRNADAVAELTVGLLLACSRGLLAADRDVRAGEVYRDGTIPYQRFRAWQLLGRTAGLVGLGAVGPRHPVATRGPRHAGHRLRSVRRRRHPRPRRRAGRGRRGVDARRRHAGHGGPDVGGPLRRPAGGRGVPQRRPGRAPRRRRPGRRPAVGPAGGRGLDHFAGESLAPDHPLAALPNVVLTPHIGGATYDTEANHTTLMAEGLAALLRGEAPANLANPEVLDRG